jgi:hypothetical protein
MRFGDRGPGVFGWAVIAIVACEARSSRNEVAHEAEAGQSPGPPSAGASAGIEPGSAGLGGGGGSGGSVAVSGGSAGDPGNGGTVGGGAGGTSGADTSGGSAGTSGGGAGASGVGSSNGGEAALPECAVDESVPALGCAVYVNGELLESSFQGLVTVASVEDVDGIVCSGVGSGGRSKRFVLEDGDGFVFHYLVTLPELPAEVLAVADTVEVSLVVEEQSIPFGVRFAQTVVLARDGEIALLSGDQVQQSFPRELEFASYDLRLSTQGTGCQRSGSCRTEPGILNVTFGDQSGQVGLDETAQIGDLVLGVNENHRFVDGFCDSFGRLRYAGFAVPN